MGVLVWIGVTVFLFAMSCVAVAEYIARGVPVLPSSYSDTREVEITGGNR